MDLILHLINKFDFMENLQLSNSCINCENMSTNSLCSLHNVEASEQYPSTNFEVK